MKGNFNSRKFKGGAYTTVVSLLVIVILIIVNLLVSAAVKSKDLTSMGTYSLSKETKEYLKDLKEDVNMYYVTENGEENLLFKSLAEMFAKESDHITLTYKDPVQYPQFVYQYNNMGEIHNNSIILENASSPERYTYIDYEEMLIYVMDTQSTPPTKRLYGYDTEMEIVKGLLQVTSEDFKEVYFTTGHGETETILNNSGAATENLANLLELNQCRLHYVDLSRKNSVPKDCDLLIIAGANKDLTESEGAMIRDYMSKSGNVMIFLCVDYNNVQFPQLSALLDFYGMNLNPGMLMEGDSSHTGSDKPYLLISEYNGGNVSWPMGCGVTVKENLRDTLAVTTRVTTSGKAYVQASSEQDSKPQEGKYSLLTYAEETYQGNRGRMFVFNTYLFLSDNCIDASVPLKNRELLLSTLSEVTGSQREISIPVKQNREEALSMTGKERNRLAIFSIGIIPGLFLLAGIVVVIRRRR